MLFREANDKMTVMGEEDEEYTPPGEIFVKGGESIFLRLFVNFSQCSILAALGLLLEI